MPGVVLPPQPTPYPPGLVVQPAPPFLVEPLPDATHAAPPFTGWHSFELDYPTVRYFRPGRRVWRPQPAAGQIHRSEAGGLASFPFQGEALRVRYVAAQNMGTFEVIVDGVLLETIDAYAELLAFPATEVYVVGPGRTCW